MIVSGGMALIWTDPAQGGGWTWPEVYRLMALLMVAAVLSALLLPRLPACRQRRGPGAGWRAACGRTCWASPPWWRRWRWGSAHRPRSAPLARRCRGPLLDGSSLPGAAAALGRPGGAAGWASLHAAAGAWAARRARFDTLLAAAQLLQPARALAFLAFIVLYKLGDAFAGSLMTPFLLKSMALRSAEVGVVNKVIGLWLTIAGRAAGWRADAAAGAVARAAAVRRAAGGQQPGLLVAGARQGRVGGLLLPAFDWGFVQAGHSATPVDGGLLMVVAFENLAGGMGTAAFVAFLMSLCSQRFSATQYALLSAFASVGRVWVGPLAGVLAEASAGPPSSSCPPCWRCRRW
jgi:PAT family beta-lactamase induction signal transducer AmpG